MSQKTGTVKVHSAADGSNWSATITFPGPPVTEETWLNPPQKPWDVLCAACAKGGTVTIAYDDSTQPPTRTGVQAN